MITRKRKLSPKNKLWKGGPEKSLTIKLKNTGGNNNVGRRTCRTMSNGGNRRKGRVLDLLRDKKDVEATIMRVEYDPHRSCHIALVKYEDDDELRYVSATANRKIGDKIISGDNVEPYEGNALLLSNIPTGIPIHNITDKPGGKAMYARSAGIFAKIVSKGSGRVLVELPSKEVKSFDMNCMATMGQLSNGDHMNQKKRKAGDNRHIGRKPTSRGVAQNPVDHANGGRTSGGKVLRSANGNMIKGKKTRARNKPSNSLIIKTRRENRR